MENQLPFLQRFWIYQRERFPLFAHGFLILAFAGSAAGFSAQLRQGTWPSWPHLLLGFGTSFTLFLLLRLCDEIKDAYEDAKYRPYRPVPRGLVSLKEIKFWIACIVFIQILVHSLWAPVLLPYLFLVYLWLALMSFEFGVPHWLNQRPMVYMISHMIIMPFLDFYATAIDWSPYGQAPQGLIWFLIVSFFNGMVIEVGRKLRCAEEEEIGVKTYSFLYGSSRAFLLWIIVLSLTFASALYAASFLASSVILMSVLCLLYGALVLYCFPYFKNPTPQNSKRLENFSGLWTLFMYLILGALPWVLTPFI